MCETKGSLRPLFLKHRGACGMQNDIFGGRFFGFEFDYEEAEEETCENINCDGTRQNPVCGEYRDIIQPYYNKCEMKKASCSIARNLYSIQARGKVIICYTKSG